MISKREGYGCGVYGGRMLRLMRIDEKLFSDSLFVNKFDVKSLLCYLSFFSDALANIPTDHISYKSLHSPLADKPEVLEHLRALSREETIENYR